MYQIYKKDIDVLYFDLLDETYINDFVFRDVKLWIEQIKRFKNLKTLWILDACFENFVKQWCNIYSMLKTLRTSNVKFICFFLIKKFVMTKQKQKIESEFAWEKLIEHMTRKKQQVKHARLAKKIEKARIKKKRAKVFACKRCFVKFLNNIKFYQHVQNHHQKKFAIKFAKHIFTFSSNELVLFVFNEIVLFSRQFFISSLISLSTLFIILFTFIESILFATSKKQIFWTKIASKSIISSKSSRLSISILEFLKSTSIIFSSISSQISTSTKTYLKIYLTMNNLFVMFFEKSKSLNLLYRQKHTFSQHHWRSNKLVIFLFYQIRITLYFLSSLNSFKFNILSKSNFCLFIQTNVFRRFIFFCEQTINFASRNTSIFMKIMNLICILIFVVVANTRLNSIINFTNIFVIAKKVSNVKFRLETLLSFEKNSKDFFRCYINILYY